MADRYTLERELGRGGMATVYLARDLKHDRQVALKVLHPNVAATLGSERFLREIRLTARLQHTHILPVFDSGTVAGQPWYTMPYVRGESLRDRLRREVQLPVEEALEITRQVALALDYAHREGTVHRDIKPENILLSQDQAFVADFGVARAIGSAAEEALTGTGLAIGTPAYMAPEQASGGQVDGRTDIYALACVMYELLAGEPPFTGLTPQAIVAKRFAYPAPSVLVVRPNVPRAVDQAIRKAMATVPADRFAAAEQFAQALAGASLQEKLSGRNALLPWMLALAGIATISGALVGGARLLHRPVGAPVVTTEPRMLVVLPFRNLGDSADTYFADGLTEELTTRLASLRGLRVISRTSTERYRESTLSLQEIGAELGAGYVLEGSVHLDRGTGPDRVRVRPRLISVADDSQLWSEPYEVEITRLFQVQFEIAERVTREMDVALRESERGTLATAGTDDLEAYDFYLRGNDYLGRGNQHKDLGSAARLYRQAVDADPRFAAAYAKLARCHMQIYWHYYDRTDARLALAKSAIDSAVQLGPNLPETRIAQGYYRYWGHLDYEGALRDFEAALRLQPSNSELLRAIGYVERRRGRWQESLARFVEALRYDPRSGPVSFDVGDNYLTMHQFTEAEHYLERAMTLSPDWPVPYIYRAWLHVVWRGDLARGRAFMAQGLSQIEPGRFAPFLHTGDRISASLVTADSAFWPMLDGLTLATFVGDTVRYHLLKSEAAYFKGSAAAERAHGDSARSLLEHRLRSRPDDAKLLGPLALAYSHLRRHADAVRAAERAAELLPPDVDAVSGPYVLAYLARVYTTAGRYAQAVTTLERLMDTRSWITPAELRVDPIWRPLQNDPRFQKLAGEPIR